MTPEQDARECFVCPPWVVACAHLDGLIAWTADMLGVPSDQRMSDRRFIVHGPTTITNDSTEFNKRWHKGCAASPGGDCLCTDDLAAAQQDLARRSAILMGREPEPALP